MTSRPLLTPRKRLAAALFAAAGLAGCISLLPKERPVQLYSFVGPPLAAPAPLAPGARKVAVRATLSSFERAAASDRLLTADGNAADYIANARWVASAQSLFESALTARFDAASGPAQLLTRSEPAASDARLDLAVTRFEARYDRGPGAPPTVIVEIRASLDAQGASGAGRSQTFIARVPAEENRVRAIVAAYAKAVGSALDALVAWTNANA
ncbi:MAG: membrane integrity-associated transporter subunit PqiC [Alphaproteobacteria bacterium]|nr:membrane integrity-associated transporter subunit PqiC [Alphaproteobacteria bacterium]